jgi:essential nuclear protein 1
MPKAKRIRSAALAAQLTRHQPLGQVLAQDAAEQAHGKLTSRKKMKKGRRGNKEGEDDTADDLLLDAKTSQRILELSKRQQLEMETEEQQQEQAATGLRRGNGRSAAPKRQNQRKDSDDDEDDEKEDDDDEAWEDDTGGDGMIVRDTNDRYISVAEGTLSPEDEALVNAMMNPNNNSNSGQQQPRQSLADLILAKIDEKESAVLALSSNQSQQQQPSSPPGGAAMPPKVVHVYTEIGKLLSRYTSGKLPKAFKVIPSLTHWEDVLYLTRPDLWTPQAMYAATRIFASNLNPHMAQRFYNLVLLDAVRADIQHNKKLNYHYYMALKKGTVPLYF